MQTSNMSTAKSVTTYKNINDLCAVHAQVNNLSTSDDALLMYETITTIELLINEEVHVYFKKVKKARK